MVDRPSTGAQLLAAVIEDPDDVERRLVYADYLIEQGDPQGELIHLCERYRILEPRDESLRARITELERELGPRIAGFVAEVAKKYWLARGFVSIVEMNATEFAEHGERLLAEHPVERFDLHRCTPEQVAVLVEAPATRALRGLHLRQNQEVPFSALCRSPSFELLRSLEVWNWTTPGDPLDAFAHWQAPSLASVTLFKVDSAAQIIAGLSRNEGLRLERLCVTLVDGLEWTGATLEGPSFAELRSLRLLRSVGCQGDVEPLLDSAELPMLRDLALDDPYPVERFRFPQLQSLNLRGPIDARTFERLIDGHPRIAMVEIAEMPPEDVNRALEFVLGLPQEHPLEYLLLPRDGVDRRLLARVMRRLGERARVRARGE
ncbi:MAG: TIGR02996 domain-containing protein [Enhygromyxa sp.]